MASETALEPMQLFSESVRSFLDARKEQTDSAVRLLQEALQGAGTARTAGTRLAARRAGDRGAGAAEAVAGAAGKLVDALSIPVKVGIDAGSASLLSKADRKAYAWAVQIASDVVLAVALFLAIFSVSIAPQHANWRSAPTGVVVFLMLLAVVLNLVAWLIVMGFRKVQMEFSTGAPGEEEQPAGQEEGEGSGTPAEGEEGQS